MLAKQVYYKNKNLNIIIIYNIGMYQIVASNILNIFNIYWICIHFKQTAIINCKLSESLIALKRHHDYGNS